MRTLKLLAVIFAGAALLTSCEKGDPGDGGATETVTIDFEGAQLQMQSGNYSPKYDNILWGAGEAEPVENGDNVYDDILYTEDGAGFGSYYNDSASGDYPGDYWGGFAISSNDNKDDLGYDYSNQFSVYASTAIKFAIGFDSSFMGSTAAYDKPVIEFSAPRRVKSARIANSNKTYYYCINNPKGAAGETDILFELVASGYRADAATGEDVETGSITVTLANGAEVLSDWKEVSFTALGEVEKIVFSIEANDYMAPLYFCIDDINIE